MPPPTLLGPLLVLLLAAPVGELLAAEEEQRWALCPAPAPSVPPSVDAGDTPEPGVTRVRAARGELDTEGVSHFGGGVEIRRDDKYLSADEARYDHQQDRLQMWGNVDYRDPRLQVRGERGEMQLDSGLGRWEEGDFFLPQAHAYIHAGRFEMTDSQEHSLLTDVRYTTCPPGRRAWELSASQLRLDREQNLGEAYHAVLRLGGVPIFYTPYINYPLEGRKSGLLSPTYGSSERNGHDFSLPYYWNIAPHRDATFTPRLISERGGQLQAEYRYRELWGNGTLNGEWMSADQLYGDKERGYLELSHRSNLESGWRLGLDYREASDRDYFNDIDSPLVNRSQAYLPRNASASYLGEGWSFSARVQDFQPLGDNATPYQLAPQLRFEGATAYRPNYPRLELYAELAHFQHSSLVPTGSRGDIKPRLSWPLNGDAWFLTPAVAWRHTAYQLDVPLPGQPEDPSRALPISSLDAGLFFERDYQIGQRRLRHTIEPRLFYLQVPYHAQDNLPLFDSAEMAFSFPQLFRDNRFSGADRQGDARQLTVALSSRIQDNATGAELARLSLGQIHYLDRPLVTLNPAAVPEQRAYSDWVAEISAQPLKGLELSGGGRWNPELGQSEESSARVALVLGEERSISYGHRYHRVRAEKHHDLLMLWPLSARWHGVGRWYYDAEDARTVESLLGLEYRSCCWNLRVVGRSKPYYDTVRQEWAPDHSLFVTLELKGLGTAGRKLNDVIREGILGYY